MTIVDAICGTSPHYLEQVTGGAVIAINHKGLVLLDQSGDIEELWLARHAGDEWALFVRTKEGEEAVLYTAHKGPRYWKNITNAVKYVRSTCPSVDRLCVILR